MRHDIPQIRALHERRERRIGRPCVHVADDGHVLRALQRGLVDLHYRDGLGVLLGIVGRLAAMALTLKMIPQQDQCLSPRRMISYSGQSRLNTGVGFGAPGVGISTWLRTETMGS